MTPEPSDLLDLPAPLAVRRIALGFLEEAAAAHARLMNQGDDKALHDFRVALRRLRTWLRADAWTGTDPPRKIARRLRRIARATNTARDAEVLLNWAATHRDALRSSGRRATAWLADWLAARGGDANRKMQTALADFDDHASAWRESLAILHVEQRVDDPAPAQPFRAHAGRLIGARCDALNAALAAIKGAKDHEHIHAARIAGKRLRYAIEPLAPVLPAAEPVIIAMKTIQDDFGFACDRDIFIQMLAKAARAAGKQVARAAFAQALAAESRPARRVASAVPGLVALARIANAEARTQYRHLRHRYLGADGEQVLEPARQLADALHAKSSEIV